MEIKNENELVDKLRLQEKLEKEKLTKVSMQSQVEQDLDSIGLRVSMEPPRKLMAIKEND